MLLRLLFGLICMHQTYSELAKSEQEPEPLYEFFKKIYGTSRMIVDSDDTIPPLLLTPYIKENNLEEAREAALVDADFLDPDIESYSGYLTVNEEYNSNLFFWYFPVADKPVDETPWILWLQGTPGASSLYGLFTEIGPFFVTEDLTLEEREYSWGKEHSLLFIDSPVGAGFSFTDDERGYATNQTMIGEDLYRALQQFLTIFPELREAPLTISGESYAGKHIPSLGVQIHWHKDEEPPINLHGLAIGNGFIDPSTLQRYSFFAREVGLVDDQVANQMRKLERDVLQSISEGEMIKAFDVYVSLLNFFASNAHVDNLYNYLDDDDISLGDTFVDFLQRDEVREMIHVGSKNFNYIGNVLIRLVPDFMNSAKMWLEELLENYQVMLYNGHLDMIVAYHPSVNTYNSLSFSGSSEFKEAPREPWYHEERLAGYYKVAGNLTEVMIRGAGHMVPADKPAAALGLISAFIRGYPLSYDTAFLVNVDEAVSRRKKILSKP